MDEQQQRKRWPPAADPLRGLECKACGCRMFNVLHTRPMVGYIIRERECRNCGKKMRTKETLT